MKAKLSKELFGKMISILKLLDGIELADVLSVLSFSYMFVSISTNNPNHLKAIKEGVIAAFEDHIKELNDKTSELEGGKNESKH